MALTETEKKEMLKKATKLFNRAYRNRKEAEKILEALGIHACSEAEGYYNGVIEPEVQLYSGIKELEKVELKVLAKPRAFESLADYQNISWIKIDGINFFQMHAVLEDGSYGLR